MIITNDHPTAPAPSTPGRANTSTEPPCEGLSNLDVACEALERLVERGDYLMVHSDMQLPESFLESLADAHRALLALNPPPHL